MTFDFTSFFLNTSPPFKSTLNCTKPNCIGAVPIATGKCCDCGLQLPDFLVEKAKTLKSKISKISSESKKNYLPSLYKPALKLLHPFDNNFMHLMNLAWAQWKKDSEPKNFALGLEIFTYILQNHSMFLPQYCFTIASEKNSLAQLCSHNDLFQKFSLAKKYNAEALKCVEICFGKEHPVFEFYKSNGQQIEMLEKKSIINNSDEDGKIVLLNANKN